MTIDKTARQNGVLEAIVKMHVETTLPVGSKYIGRMLGLSSATIRGAMFELEKAGYIKQPHTSAGRVPTDLGYRRYVDSMKSPAELPQDDIFSKIKDYVSEKRFFEEVIEATSRALSRITNYIGIALSPRHNLYCDGTYRMFEQPEFKEVSMARNFLRALEEKNELLHIMNQDLGTEGTVIHIGRENVFEELIECTIVTSTYKFRSRVSGNVGIVGPMRMKYEKVVPMVRFLAETTTEALEAIEE